MAIKMRRGDYQDFNPNKLLPGEWAVSLDKKYVHMCFAHGVVSRMATYDAFEEDMLQVQAILATCQDIQAAAEAFSNLAKQHSVTSESYSIESKSWAIGGTGSRTGEDTNNSKYFSVQSKAHADRSKTEADRAKTEADRASTIVGIGIATDSKAGIIKGNPDEFSIGSDGKLSLTSSFTAQSTLSAITGTENKKTLFGKLAKGVSDLISHIGDTARHFTLTNNLLATAAGTALDATQGKVLNDKINDINSNLTKKTSKYYDNETMPFTAFRTGNLVELSVARNKILLVKGTTYVMANLSAEYRPASTYQTMTPVNTVGGVAYVYVTTSGDVGIRPYTNVAVGEYTFYRLVYTTVN